MTSEEHNKYISWVFLAHAGFQLLMMLMSGLMFMFLIPMFMPPGQPAPPRAMFLFMIGFMLVIQSIFTAPSLVAAYALRKKKPWARIAAIVAGAAAAMHVPIGTAACVYSMWFFVGENWKEVYPEQAGVKPTPQQLSDFNPERWEGSFKTDENGRAVFTPAEPPDWRS